MVLPAGLVPHAVRLDVGQNILHGCCAPAKVEASRHVSIWSKQALMSVGTFSMVEEVALS